MNNKPIRCCRLIVAGSLSSALFAIGWSIAEQPRRSAHLSGGGLTTHCKRPTVDRKWVEPGGTPDDTAAALFEPDEYAWRLFLELNRQALGSVAGEADPSRSSCRTYDDDAPVVWETWALASGNELEPENNYSEVFHHPVRTPVPWSLLQRAARKSKELDVPVKFTWELGIVHMYAAERPCSPKILPPDNEREETRMNRSTYETIVAHDLYFVEGIERAYRAAATAGRKSIVDFERAAKEIKAQWVVIDEVDKPRFHWRTDRDGIVWGLAALHMTTKDIPNWFWCTFVHYDRMLECHAVRDSTTLRTGGVRPETVGSKWAHYRLQGTQNEFMDARGERVPLANPAIEGKLDQWRSTSCMSCHALAAVADGSAGVRRNLRIPSGGASAGHRTAHMGFEKGIDRAGPPDREWFGTKEPTGYEYLQSDFVWSILMRAYAKNPQP